MRDITPTFPYDNFDFTYDPGPFAALAESDLGRAIWAFLTRPETIHAMVVGVRLGAAPATAISADLLATFGSGDRSQTPREALAAGLVERFPSGARHTLDTVKRMIGHMIRQIMERLGFALHTRNSPAGDRLGIFSTAARYRPATEHS